MRKTYTAESVTEGHPDKLCDLISDTVLDACLKEDPGARVACECLAAEGHIVVAGEISCAVMPDIASCVRVALLRVGYDPEEYEIHIYLHGQSEDIAMAVEAPEDDGVFGAGDQGVMVGYATSETGAFLPLPWVLARRMTDLLTMARLTRVIRGIGPDGKAQVTAVYEDGAPLYVEQIVVSVQHEPNKDLQMLEREIRQCVIGPALRGIATAKDLIIRINPSGSFVLGGPKADTGLTGRKLMVDAYGPIVPHGGGAFSGKDATKLDRSGAYMARYIAKNLVAARMADRCQVTLAYAIGCSAPVMVEVDTFGTGRVCADDCLAAAVRSVFDLTPAGIREQLHLDKPIFADTAALGHFGREELPWEQLGKVQALRDAIL